jgi:hypothetical protein
MVRPDREGLDGSMLSTADLVPLDEQDPRT